MNKLKQLFIFSKQFTAKEQFKNYLKMVFLWCPLVSILFIFGFGGFDHFVRRFVTSFIIASTVATWCMAGTYLVNSLYQFFLRRKGLEVNSNKRGVLWGVFTSYLFLLPGLYFGFALVEKFASVLGHSFNTPDFSDYTSGIIFGILVSGLFGLFQVARDLKETKQDAEVKFRKLENEKLKAQISALSAQMNPHLLFNSLNTIAAAISNDPKSAEDMVVQLSELYRGILKSAKGDSHSLENELLLCKSYLDIEKRRFGSRIDYQIHIAEDIDPQKIKIPVLLLQPLVENAIQHGLAPKKEGGKILVDIQKNNSHIMISVIDNGLGINQNKSSNGTGTGLSNCESRAKMKYAEDSTFRFGRNEKNETVVALSLPLKELAYD